MINKHYPMLLIGLFTWLSHAVTAAPLNDLYTTTVPVTAQTTAERRQAAAVGLTEVLIRMSGRSTITEEAKLSRTLDNAHQLMKQFTYQYLPDQVSGEERLHINITFEAEQVDALLRTAGLPRWSTRRPDVLLLLTIDENASRALIGTQTHQAVAAMAEDRSRYRGLPLQLPAMDFQDT